MTTYQSHLGLLPTGFVDLMPEDAEREALSIQILMDLFTAYDYSRIKPPLLEFEESLFAQGPGGTLQEETFRVMDPGSHRMMGLRADSTPQIARIVCSRLQEASKPVRLTYANDVLRNKAGQLRSARQFCQVGCEIIHDSSASSYAELVILSALGLKELGVRDITFDFTAPRLIDQLLEAYEIHDGELDNAIRIALSKRDRDALQKLDHEIIGILLELLSCTGKIENKIDELLSLDLPERAMQNIRCLKQAHQSMTAAFYELQIDDVTLTFDPFENKGFDYHRGLAFTVFAKSLRGELGRGGRYDVKFGELKVNEEPYKAIGFTLYMDTILQGVELEAQRIDKTLEKDASWADMEKLRQNGFKIKRG